MTEVEENTQPAFSRSSIVLITLFAAVIGLLGYWDIGLDPASQPDPAATLRIQASRAT